MPFKRKHIDHHPSSTCVMPVRQGGLASATGRLAILKP